jgi:transcriptional regulator with XRE-family HTH domain
MAPTQSQIGSWLAEIRELREMTQKQAGDFLQKDPQQVSKWERGEKKMSAESFLALVQLYKAQKELVTFLATSVERATRPSASESEREKEARRRAG